MGTFVLRSAKVVFALLLGTTSFIYAQDQSCLTITSLDGATPAVSYDTNQLKVQVQGKFRQEGATGEYTLSAGNGTVVFSRDLAAGSAYSVTPAANSVKVCVQQAAPPVTVTPTPSGPGVTPLTATPPSGSSSSTASAAPSSTSSATPSNDSAAKGKSCIDDKVNCDVGATVESLTAPESPAFTVLGVAPSEITRPTSPSDFSTFLVNAFDEQGHFQSGLALDAAPFLLLGNKLSWWSHYGDPTRKSGDKKEGKKYWWVPPLARTTVSFGTTKGASDSDPALRLAVGVRIVLYDERDPRLLYARCIRDEKLDPNMDPKEAIRKLREVRERCIKKTQEIWNARSLTIAGAPTWFSKDGSSSSLQLNGGGYWASGALRIGTTAQILGHFRRTTGQEVPDPVTPKDPITGLPNFVIQSSTLAGGSVRYGSAKFNGRFDGLYVHKKVAGILDTYPEFGFGLERKLAENLYLDASYRYAPGTKLTASGFLSNLKWNFNKLPKLNLTGK
jgi:hypothetical protein